MRKSWLLEFEQKEHNKKKLNLLTSLVRVSPLNLGVKMKIDKVSDE